MTILLALLLACSQEPLPPLPPQKVIVLGLDGASWVVLGDLLDKGQAPGFARLVAEGAHMEQFDTMSSTRSPVVWTSVATGRQPEDHGITDFTEDLPGGGRVPVTGNSRKVPAIWNIATDAGLSVGVVGWWASWPAETVNGYVISDHANPVQAGWMSADKKYWTADADRLAAMGRDVYPPDLAASLERYWIAPDAFPTEELRRRSGLNDEQIQLTLDAPWNDRAPYSWFKTFFALDFPLFEAGRELARTQPTDLQLIYLRGPDPVQHYAWDLVEPDKFARKPAHLERDRDLVPGLYRYLDTFVQEELADLPENTTLIVLSDHGGEPVRDAHKKHRKSRPGRHTRAAKGVLFMAGPGVKPGYEIDDADPLDIMPTVAWLLGLPVARDLPGHPLKEAFTKDFRERRGLTHVDSYGVREVQPPLPSVNDDAMLEQLRGLGYIDNDGPSPTE